MNKNILIVMAGAIAIAVVVAMLVNVTMGGKKKQAVEVKKEARVEILVAAKNLKIGNELKEGDTRWQSWPKSGVFPGAVKRADKQKPQEAIEGRLARDISQGEPIVQTALIGQSAPNFVAASLAPGMRAMAIEVSAETMVGGFIGPGDFVDIILTYKENISPDEENPKVLNYIELNLEKYATETILQNVKILAVDQSTTRPEKDKKAKVAKTVSVAVGPKDAERLSLASQLGDLNLVLRGVGDDKQVEKTWPTVSDARLTTMDDEIYSGYSKIKEEEGINRDVVKIYRGDQLSVVPTK